MGPPDAGPEPEHAPMAAPPARNICTPDAGIAPPYSTARDRRGWETTTPAPWFGLLAARVWRRKRRKRRYISSL